MLLLPTESNLLDKAFFYIFLFLCGACVMCVFVCMRARVCVCVSCLLYTSDASDDDAVV